MPKNSGGKLKRKRGRPKREIDSLPKDWETTILTLKKEGAADVEVRAALGISKDLWARWVDEIEEFSATVKKGEDLCEAWWLAHGHNQLENKNFNAVLWFMNMRNRFGWRNEVQVQHEAGVTFLEAIRIAREMRIESERKLIEQAKQ